MHLIELKNISKSYGEVDILKDLFLSIDGGFSYAITGKSGAGKSTLLHILALLDKACDGKYFIEEKELSDDDLKNDSYISALRNKKFGFVFQDNYLISEYTALENVMVPALITGERENRAKERAKELLKMLGLEQRFGNLPSQLSTGERQRVSICRAIMNDPEIIFADEPTGSLDEENAAVVESLLLDVVKKQNKTLVLVTHNPDFALKCDVVYRLINHNLERTN